MASTSDSVNQSIAKKAAKYVTLNMNYYESSDGGIIAHPELVFSNQERAKTNLSAQGDHTVALALSLERVINTINTLFPTKNNDYQGITNLVKEIYDISEQDKFLLTQFFPKDPPEDGKYDENNIFILGQFGKNGPPEVLIAQLADEISFDGGETNKNIELLNGIIHYMESTRSSQTENYALDEHVVGSYNLALKLKQQYCARVATKAGQEIVKYQNLAPWAAFEKRTPDGGRNGPEGIFNAGESSRVKLAMAALRSFSEDSVAVLSTHIVNLLYYPRVDDNYSAKATEDYKRSADRHLGNNVYADQGPIPRINKRTNDESIFCYVVTRHLATVFAAFPTLSNDVNKKKEIIDTVINNIIHPNNYSGERQWEFSNEAVTKGKIKEVLEKWEQKKSSVGYTESLSAQKPKLPDTMFEQSSVRAFNPDYLSEEEEDLVAAKTPINSNYLPEVEEQEAAPQTLSSSQEAAHQTLSSSDEDEQGPKGGTRKKRRQGI